MKRRLLPALSSEGDRKKVPGWRIYPTVIARVRAAADAKNVSPELLITELLEEYFNENNISADVVRVPMGAVVVRVEEDAASEEATT